MNIPERYQPKYLTPEQTTLIDDLATKHKALFFDKDTERAKIKSIQAEINYKTEDLTKRDKKGSSFEAWSIKYLADIVQAFFPELAMEPVEYWIHGQTDILRRELDQKIPLFTPHPYIPNEKTRQNIVDEIKSLKVKLDKYHNIANLKRKGDPDFLDSIGRLHAIIFQIKIMSDFYKSLLLQPELSVKEELTEINADSTDSQEGTGTTNQHVLLIYYVLEYAKLIDPQIDKSKYAKFIRFLTGKNYDNIRGRWSNKHKRNNEAWVKDMKTIRPLLEAIGAFEVVRMIDNDLAG